MELRRYLQIIRAWWWLVLIAFVVTAGATLALVLPQPPVYESKGTFVVRPRSLDSEEVVNAFDTLIRGVEINATYAAIARSDLIRSRAEERVGPEVSTSDLSVDAQVVTGTNIVSISVRGLDRDSAQAFAEAVGAETVAYVVELNDAYQLDPLDPATSPASPAGPNKRLTLVLGLMFGAALGVGLALFAEYLRGAKTPSSSGTQEEEEEEASVFNIIDPQTNVYNEPFFRIRLHQEISRAKRTGRSFSFAVLHVAPSWDDGSLLPRGPASRDRRRVAEGLKEALHEEAVLASLDDGTFALLLPEMSVSEARELAVDWEVELEARIDGDGNGSGPRISIVGVCEYRDPAFLGDPEAERVARRLTEARPR